MRLSVLVSVVLSCASLLWLASALDAEDFRIESKVFEGKERKSVIQTTTLFYAGFVYDYLTSPDQVAVFDKAHGRFILLDIERKVKTEINTSALLEFSNHVKARAEKSSNALLKFAASPAFETQYDEKTGDLTLTSPQMTYELKTVKAKNATAEQQYRDFSDWYTRLNVLLNPGTTPPFARLSVDEELAKRELAATEVKLIIPQKVTLRSEHKILWRLLQRDHDRIVQTANQLTTFKTVDLAEFQQLKLTKR